MLVHLRDRLLALWVAFDAGEAPAADLILWAENALLHGYDSPSVRVLASLLRGESDAVEVQTYARRAAAEHGMEVPEGEPLRRAYISVACRGMLQGDLAPDLALERIHRWVVSPLGHPQDLMRWCYLWEGNGPECEYLEEPNTAYALEEARRWLAAEPGVAAHDEPGGRYVPRGPVQLVAAEHGVRRLPCRAQTEMKEKIAAMVEAEIATISDSDLAAAIRRLVVEPYPVEREWDYGAPGVTYTCWTVLEHRPSNTGIAYCAQGFGPQQPWGLVSLAGEHMNIGMDCEWFARLEDAMRDSMAWEGEAL